MFYCIACIYISNKQMSLEWFFQTVNWSTSFDQSRPAFQPCQLYSLSRYLLLYLFSSLFNTSMDLMFIYHNLKSSSWTGRVFISLQGCIQLNTHQTGCGGGDAIACLASALHRIGPSIAWLKIRWRLEYLQCFVFACCLLAASPVNS